MKSQVIAALLASTSAVKLGDAPPHFSEPTWQQTWPSAAGFVQMSACQRFQRHGVSCGSPADINLFATGMNGDEDLGQDITMKGQKFHYAQGVPANSTGAFATPANATGAFATPANATGAFATPANATGAFATPVNATGAFATPANATGAFATPANATGAFATPANSTTSLFATGMNGDEDLGQDITMKGQKFHYAQGDEATCPKCGKEGCSGKCTTGLSQEVCECGANGCTGCSNNFKEGLAQIQCGPNEKKQEGANGLIECGPADKKKKEEGSGLCQGKNCAGCPDCGGQRRRERAPGSDSLMQQAPFPLYEGEPAEKVMIPQTTWARHHTTYY